MATFRSVSSSDNDSSSNLVVTKPIGTTDGDLLLAVCVNSGSAGIFTVPSGWSSVFNEAMDGVDGYVAVFSKSALTEGSNYTFTSSGTYKHVAILCYQDASGVDVSAISHQPSPENAPSVTTSADNEIVVRAHVGSGGSISAPTAPGTSRLEELSGDSNNEISIGESTKSTAGATGTAFFTGVSIPDWSISTFALVTSGGIHASNSYPSNTNLLGIGL